MALPSPSRTLRLDLASRDSTPADSAPLTSQGGSSNGAKAEVGRKTKEGVNRLLAKLEKEGVEIDDKLASIIDDGIARIKAEDFYSNEMILIFMHYAHPFDRENVSEPKMNWVSVLGTIACISVGYMMGVEWYGCALLAANCKDKKANAKDKK